MAYCSGTSTELTPKDIAGVQHLYKRHLPGTLLNAPGSLCLSGHADAANGENAFGWECDEAKNDQEWKYDPVQQALWTTDPADPNDTQRCLDVDSNNGTDVQVWDCLNNVNQRWTFRRVEIRGFGGLCLTRPTGAPGPVTMEECAGSSEQLWWPQRISTTGLVRLKSESGDFCLVASESTNAPVAVEPCYVGGKLYLPFVKKPLAIVQEAPAPGPLTPAQAGVAAKTKEFKLVAGGMIGIKGPGALTYCLDVQDASDDQYMDGTGGPREGQTVQAFPCTYTPLNQRWNFTGDLSIASNGRCLTLSGDRLNNGAPAVVQNCTNTAEQDWDYHW